MPIYFYGCITLDGYLATKDHNLDWLYTSGSIEETSYDKFYKNMDITIMGKHTFNAIKDLDNPGSIYSSTTNYVFTHQKDLNIEVFIPVEGNIIDFIHYQDKNKNIWIIGGNTILKPLIEANFFDKMYIQIAPVLLGDGIALFTQKEQLFRYKLVEVNKYGQFAEIVYEKL